MFKISFLGRPQTCKYCLWRRCTCSNFQIVKGESSHSLTDVESGEGSNLITLINANAGVCTVADLASASGLSHLRGWGQVSGGDKTCEHDENPADTGSVLQCVCLCVQYLCSLLVIFCVELASAVWTYDEVRKPRTSSWFVCTQIFTFDLMNVYSEQLQSFWIEFTKGLK